MTSPPALLLCADSGPGVGLGHVSRCLALAEEAVARGWSAVLAADPGPFGPRLAELGIGVLPPVVDVEGVRAHTRRTGAAVVVVDDHRIAGDPRVPGVLVVCVSDGPFGRRPGDVVVDPNLRAEPTSEHAAPVVLHGPRFAPLRSSVRAARARRAAAPPTGARVVVALGGAAWPAVAEAALVALRDTGLPLDAVAVAPCPLAVPPALPGQRLAATTTRSDLAALFAGADLVISAAGVTMLELCCIGVPTALVRLADNQAPGYRAAVTRGLAAGLGSGAELVADRDAATTLLRDLLGDPVRRAGLATAGRGEVDGAGAGRVLDVALAAATARAREATAQDADLLREWRNDPESRAWSVDTAPVPPEVHRRWLDAVLASDDRLLLVVDSAAGALGSVRFDREGDGWCNSTIVAPAMRGRGLAAVVLDAAEATLHERHGGGRLVAWVHEANVRSLAMFRRAGWTELPDQYDAPFRRLATRLPARPVRRGP